MNLSKEQVDILLHTHNRAANHAYCGDSPDMQDLVKKGLMRSAGWVKHVPDEYFCLTPAGKCVVEAIEVEGHPSELVKSLPDTMQPTPGISTAEDRAWFRKLKDVPQRGNPPVYATIHHGIGGWNSSVWGWETDPDMPAGGFYQPLNSGVTNTLGKGTREEAVREATSWARSEDLPLWIPEE